ncbi:hypothetical protein SASPL_133812 [Salvia splendens]|uniref:Uncharacterized protein n=1 Tax=Salvia splendens TaxID=180675 RepID=A0A8X8ZIU8_SALSN|nr:extensin-like [Salvia splendens]KAG6406213.1 hypothetical protein SASPL_133812 [Salvia splendens]
MVFSALRPRPSKKNASPAPPPVEKPPPAEKPAPVQNPPQGGGGGGGPPPPPPYGPFSPYMAELQRMEGLRSVEYSNSRSWRLNFDDSPNPQQYGSSEYHHYPVGDLNRRRQYRQNRMPPPPQSYGPPPPNLEYYHDSPRHAPRLQNSPRYGPSSSMQYFQPHDHYHGPMESYHGPPRQFSRPQLDYHYGYPPQYSHYGGYFSDENPNGCSIM